MTNKALDIINEVEADLAEAIESTKMMKDEPLKADVLKTIKAIGYEKLKSQIKKGS